MADIQYRSDFQVKLIDSMGSDDSIVRAARVSTGQDANQLAGDKLISFLMRNRHGTPFEHTSMTFRIEAPIFVWREFMRHRIGISYNEQSGRYMELAPVFYVPNGERPMVQVGKPGAYEFVEDFELNQKAAAVLRVAHQGAWDSYQKMLEFGIAKEVARIALPVGIYSAAYVTMNCRSMMSFLSLRTRAHDAKFPSYPQWEIEKVGNLMDVHFARCFPVTAQAFDAAGRVSP